MLRQTKYRLSNDTIIEVKNLPFASGGEADIYEIISPSTYTRQVLKIYKANKASTKEKKLNFLIANKPHLIPVGDHHSVIWPIHTAYDDKKNFCGYTMPKAVGIKLELLCTPKLPRNIQKEYERFAFSAPGSQEARMKLCFNISAALSQIHSFGSYVLVDMKPDNIMVKSDGLISIIDIDSTEIIEGRKLLFPAHVATPEYTPTEYYKSQVNIETTLIEETWDRFSLGIIFYRLLFGIHPFTGSLKAPFDKITNVGELIQNGLLPIGKNRTKFHIIPPPHRNFDKLDNHIQQLFLYALESKSNPSKRPSADDWCRVLSPAPGFQINRKLPTKSLSHFNPVYSNDNFVSRLPELVLKKPTYKIPASNIGLITRIKKSLFPTSKDKLWKTVLEGQKKVDSEFDALKSFVIKTQTEANNFYERKKKILSEEKENLTGLIKTFKVKSLPIDVRAQDFFKHEAEKNRIALQSYARDKALFEMKIKDEYERTVRQMEVAGSQKIDQLRVRLNFIVNEENRKIQSLEDELKRHLNDIKTKIQSLEKEFNDRIDEESQQKLKSINLRRTRLKSKETKLLAEALEKYQSTFSGNQLRQYKISDEKYSIFTDKYANPDRIAANLANYGIVTAHDVKGVDESGKILAGGGRWVKVPDVASTRAQQLNDWRKRKERQQSSPPPQSLPYSEEMKVKQGLIKETQKLDEEEKQLRLDITRKKSNFPRELTRQLEEFKNKEQTIVDNIQARKKQVVDTYRQPKFQLQNELAAFEKEFVQQKQLRIREYEKNISQMKETLVVLKDSNDRFLTQTKSEFDKLHDSLLEDLKLLDGSFCKEMKLIHKDTAELLKGLDDEYAVFTKKYKDQLSQKTIAFNVSADNLISNQNQLN